jgi:hypothetical protein
MSTMLPSGRSVRLAIREIGIAAASPLEARRLADAMPAALHRALAQLTAGARPIVSARQRPVDRVAAQIVRVVADRLEAAR